MFQQVLKQECLDDLHNDAMENYFMWKLLGTLYVINEGRLFE